jgi:hypothetical protein
MDYPADFPSHLQGSVDAIIAAAEIEFIDAKTTQSNTINEQMLSKYIEAVFFGFAKQCVQAGREGHWNGERIRKALAEFLDVVIDQTFRDKHPSWRKDSTVRYQFREEALRASKEWSGWREIYQDLERVFNGPPPLAALSGSTGNTEIDPTTLKKRYLASFDHKVKILDICWAAGQHYSEWKRWLRGALTPGSTPDSAFRAVLSSGMPPQEYKKKPRPNGWK